MRCARRVSLAGTVSIGIVQVRNGLECSAARSFVRYGEQPVITLIGIDGARPIRLSQLGSVARAIVCKRPLQGPLCNLAQPIRGVISICKAGRTPRVT